MSGIRRGQVKQAGMVSILVTMLLMIVVSLIVLGFAQISRRNLRQSLDRQLSTQAFYAAETGVNDTRNRIKAAGVGATIPAKTDCTNGSGATATFYSTLPSATLDASNKVAYTCLIVNPTPKSLEYGSVGQKGVVAPIQPESGTVTSLAFSWRSNQNTDTPLTGCPASTTNTFSPTGSWGCGFGVLRVDLVATSGGALTADSLMNGTMTTFLVPLASGGIGSIPFPVANQSTTNVNTRVGTTCVAAAGTVPAHCDMTITGLSASQYYVRVMSLYKSSALTVVAKDGSNNAMKLVGAQALVDSTGKAQDVLRRIQVRLPLTSGASLADYGIESSDSICKRFVAMDGTATVSKAASVVPGLTTSPVNPFCL